MVFMNNETFFAAPTPVSHALGTTNVSYCATGEQTTVPILWAFGARMPSARTALPPTGAWQKSPQGWIGVSRYCYPEHAVA